MIVNFKKFNPNGFYLMQYLNDIRIRFIILFGGSSSGKSYSVAQAVLIQSLLDGENTLVMRKVGASISKSIYEDYKVASKGLGIFGMFRFKQNCIECIGNGARIDFSGLDDAEKIKGISNYKRVQLEELSEFEFGDFKQIRKRLRGKVGQQIIGTFNPISEQHWIKKQIFDNEELHDIPMEVSIGGKRIPDELTQVKSVRMNAPKEILNPRTKEIETQPSNMVIIQSTYLNNFWVVGSPCGTYGFYDEQCVADFEHDRLYDSDYYNIYALGNWGVIRTGSEFFGSFNIGLHVFPCPYNPELPVHVSVDNNVLPYISISLWQVDYSEGISIRQIRELCVESPDNTVRKSAKKLAELVKEQYQDIIGGRIILHGDASTKASSTFDDEKRSWMDLFIDTLVKEGIGVDDRIGNRNPSVSMTGEFINAILDGQIDGISLGVDNSCKNSVDDYMSVQKDANGAILKTKVKNKVTNQTYEEHGHLCFTGDVLVRTHRGCLPIKDIKKGDFVLTEKGYSMVYNSFCSSRNSRYFSVNLLGNKLTCTYNHPIYTERGFVPMCDLKTDDIITIYRNGKICKEKLRNITVIDSFGILNQHVKVTANTLRDGLSLTGNGKRNHYTGICGSLKKVISLKGMLFIILMAITLIIQLITLLLCWLANMKNCILKNTEKIYGRKSRRDCLITPIKQLSGIVRRMVSNGISKMQKSRWLTENIRHTDASNVVRNSNQDVYNNRNSVPTTVRQHGEENSTSTMKYVLASYVELNLLSINILKRSIVQNYVPAKLCGIADVYDISVTDHTFFANNILVHNCDTFRYVIHDILREQYTLFANKRKRNIYGKDGSIRFFNPSVSYSYTDNIVYVMPNINGKLVLLRGGRIGNDWHVLDVVYRESTSTDEVRMALSMNEGTCIMECTDAYFPFVRELRENTGMEIRAMKEYPDMDRRISATSDYVKGIVRFSERKLEEEPMYSAFLTDVMNYNKDYDSKEASIALSGFVQYVVKL